MKTVRMLRDFDFAPRYGLTIVFKSGETYEGVTEAAAEAILAAEAGEVVERRVQSEPEPKPQKRKTRAR